ncbi:hypothetical protein CVT24_007802 [Panaeolus cyanescens]|uniref:Uncharacterized protein n=1 Tax=Panaeolus cyanescens TaxID=181874 RepID=A0A409YKU1_9AGAR|nr:hypothetical protein CVT24_007802 [Panaeolus cyanescens]
MLPWRQTQGSLIFMKDIVTMYQRIPKADLPAHLGQQDFSNIIALLGHLNQNNSNIDSEFGSPYAKFVQQRGKKDLRIRFFKEVVEDMQNLGFSLSQRDKYWIMKAHLLALTQPSPDLSPDALEAARTVFSQLAYPKDVAPQVDFLEYLSQSGQAALVQEMVEHICAFLMHPSSPPSVLLRMLCSVVLHQGSELSQSAKERICAALFFRLERRKTSIATPISPVRQVFDIAQLTSGFVDAVFHSSPFSGSATVANWCYVQCHKAFSPSLALEQRWDNLSILAMHYQPTVSPSTISGNIKHSDSLLWRIPFILDALQTHLAGSHLSGEQLSIVKDVARASWNLFSSSESQIWPLDIIRIYVSSFLHVAASTFAESLRQQCLAYLHQNHLLDFTSGSRLQALHLSSEYLQAYIACKGQSWTEIGTIFDTLCPDSEFETSLCNLLLTHYTHSNLPLASNLYLFSTRRQRTLDPQLLHGLALRLIAQQQWFSLSRILRDPHLPKSISEQLFTSTLRHFQVNRLEHAPSSLVKLLSDQAIDLYSEKPLHPSAKYPLRYLFGLMVPTHGAELLKLIQIILASTPQLFSPHLVDRLVSQLLKRRQVKQAAALVELFAKSPLPSTSILRSKAVIQAAEKGASVLAKRLSVPSDNLKRSKSLRLTRIIRFGTFPKSPDQVKHILYLLRQANTTPTTICRGVGMLLKAKKVSLARKLLRQKADYLDPRMRTAIGNMILHAPMGRVDLRNGRLVRYVLHTKDLLMEGYGFTPDRATLNIIVKAVLRWQGMVDASQVRRLFDQMVHEGYPAPEHLCRKHGVPFGTPPGSYERIALPSLSPHISFAKHTRPLYKLFIKAFYLRRDVSAAKTVVGILKEVEVEDIRQREKRNRARREGIIKKRKREFSDRQQQ